MEKYGKKFGLKHCTVLLGDLTQYDPKKYKLVNPPALTPRQKMPVPIKPPKPDTTSKIDLTNMVYTSRLKYKCSYCDAMFKGHGALEKHRLTHAKDEELFEPSSSDESDTESDSSCVVSDEEVEETTPPEKFTCRVCNKSLKFYVNYVIHCNQFLHFSCTKCIKTFKCRSALDSHTKLIHNVINCQQCPQQFYSVKNLDKHFAEKHCTKTTWPCEICSMAFDYFHHLVNHNKSRHSLQCSICGGEFATFALLTAHRFSYHYYIKSDSENVFECKHCKMSFDKLPEMHDHMMMHHPTKIKVLDPLNTVCDLCHVEFNSLEALQSHLEVHFAIVKVTNTVPGSEKAESLIKVKVASDNSNHRCTLCSAKHTSEDHLNEHLKSHIFVHHQATAKEFKAIETQALPAHNLIAASRPIPVINQINKTPVSDTITVNSTIPQTSYAPGINTVANSPMSSITIGTPMDISTITTTTPMLTTTSMLNTTPILSTTPMLTSNPMITTNPMLASSVVPTINMPTLTAMPQGSMIVLKGPEPQTTVNSNLMANPLVIAQNQAKVMLLDGKRYLLVADNAVQDNNMLKLLAANQPQTLSTVHPISNYLQTAINQTIVLPNSQNNSKISITNKTYNSGDNPLDVKQGTTNIVMESTKPEYVSIDPRVKHDESISSPVKVLNQLSKGDEVKTYKPKIFLKPLSQLLQKPEVSENNGTAPVTGNLTFSPAPLTKSSGSTLPIIVSIKSAAEINTEAANSIANSIAAPTTTSTASSSKTQKVVMLNYTPSHPRPIIPAPVSTVTPPAKAGVTVNSTPLQEPTAVPTIAPSAKPSVILNATLSQKPIIINKQKMIPKIKVVSAETLPRCTTNTTTTTKQLTIGPDTVLTEPSTSAAVTAEPSTSSETDAQDSPATSKTKDGKRIHKCTMCGIICKRIGRFRQHRDKYKCKVCNFGCCKLKILDGHYEQEHQYKNRCASCDMQFPTNMELQLHKKNVHLCIKCNRCYLDLSKHKTNYKCSNCEFTACNAVNLDAHYRLVHSVSSRCVPCNIPFYNLDTFAKHKEEMHFCTKCRTFKMDLNIHKTFCKGLRASDESNYTTDEIITLDSD